MVANIQRGGRIGKIDLSALPVGRFLYHITGLSPAVMHEGQILEKIQVSDDWLLKLRPGHEWARASHVFIQAYLPPHPTSPPEPELEPPRSRRK